MNPNPQAKKPINDWLYEKTKGIVQTGPFAGMTLPREESWDDGNLSCKLLGCYEEELHEFLEREIHRLEHQAGVQVVDVGCAEGYYAVGLAMRLPKAAVFAVDVSVDALRVTEQAALANGTKVASASDMKLESTIMVPDLVVMDCEGSEILYLNPENFPGLAHASIIVECHDPDEEGSLTKTLIQRFSDTHSIHNVVEGARNPNRFEVLRGLHSLDRWLAVSEGRPRMMNWLIMTPFQPRSP